MCVSKLDINVFNDDVTNIPIGQFSKEMAEFILDKKPAFKNRLKINEDILFWSGRVKHTERHINDFVSEEEFYHCVEDIPNIIQNPDYISIHPKDESVSFIKKYSQYVSVAIKISVNGEMVYRTMYPLREWQLNEYIEKGSAWEYKK